MTRSSRGSRLHRLRAIGHPLGTEDESQAWPDLHDAIREARRAYQTDGTMPDWAAIEALIGQVRLAQ